MQYLKDERYPMPEEGDMSLRLRCLVDNCFQEGQYESGMVALDRLRSPSQRPSVSHMLQLMFIVLFPPPPEEDTVNLLLGSPRKLQERKKAPLVPKQGAAQAAIFLLNAFLHTNHPLSLISGLPRFSDVNQDDPLKKRFSEQGDLSELQGEESFAGKAALQIAQETCFWACLHPEFPKRFDPKRNDDDDFVNEEPADIIGEQAWPLLAWFVQVAEKDEVLWNGKGSRILLYQIPAPRTGIGPRWDVHQVLEIIFACFKSSVESADEVKEQRWLTGSKLLNLLLKLAIEDSVSRVQLTAIMSTKLANVPLSLMSLVLGSMRPEYANLKVLMCMHHLSPSTPRPQVSIDAQRTVAVGGNAKKPRPRARRAIAVDDLPAPQPQSQTTNILVPSITDISQILGYDPPPDPPLRLRQSIFKLHLLSAFGALHMTDLTKDSDWRRFCGRLKDGDGSGSPLREILERAFPGSEDPSLSAENELRDTALSLLTVWQRGSRCL